MTKLKCKPCGLFYPDDDTVYVCDKCGGALRQIKVHNVKIKSLTIHTDTIKIGAK